MPPFIWLCSSLAYTVFSYQGKTIIHYSIGKDSMLTSTEMICLCNNFTKEITGGAIYLLVGNVCYTRYQLISTFLSGSINEFDNINGMLGGNKRNPSEAHYSKEKKKRKTLFPSSVRFYKKTGESVSVIFSNNIPESTRHRVITIEQQPGIPVHWLTLQKHLLIPNSALKGTFSTNYSNQIMQVQRGSHSYM